MVAVAQRAFRQRHEAARAGLFAEVLALCADAGLVGVAVLAVDGTKLHANASQHQNLDYDEIAREILAELVIAAYIFADGAAIPRPGPQGKVSDAELVALAVCQAAVGIPSDRQFLGLVERLLPGWFACLPDQSQYNRRLRRLTAWIAGVQVRVAELLAEGQVRARRRHLAVLRQLSRLPSAATSPATPPTATRLQEPAHLGYAAGRVQRPQRGPGRL
jgi:hypothetical protein